MLAFVRRLPSFVSGASVSWWCTSLNTSPSCGGRYEPSKLSFAAAELLDEESSVLTLKVGTLEELATAVLSSVGTKSEGARYTPGLVGQLQSLLQVQTAARNLGIVAVGFREIQDEPGAATNEHPLIKAQVMAGDDRLTSLELVQRRTSFLSMQLLKHRARVAMFAEDAKHRSDKTDARQLVLLGTYGDALELHTAESSMRLQIARNVQSLKQQLGAFPSTRDYYFQVRPTYIV